MPNERRPYAPPDDPDDAPQDDSFLDISSDTELDFNDWLRPGWDEDASTEDDEYLDDDAAGYADDDATLYIEDEGMEY